MLDLTLVAASGAPLPTEPAEVRHLIGGAWVPSADGASFERRSPSHGLTVTRAARGGAAEAEAAILPPPALPRHHPPRLREPHRRAPDRPQLLAGPPRPRNVDPRPQARPGDQAQAPLKPFVLAERLPGPEVRTDADYFAFACRHAKTDHHPAGTCRMGADPAAVTDPRLCLNGIAALRVVDASIMPTVVSSNSNAPTIMIAEKAADMIRADHGTCP